MKLVRTIKPHLFTSHHHCWHLTVQLRFQDSDEIGVTKPPPGTHEWKHGGWIRDQGSFRPKGHTNVGYELLFPFAQMTFVFLWIWDKLINLIGKNIPKNSVFNKIISCFLRISLSTTLCPEDSFDWLWKKDGILGCVTHFGCWNGWNECGKDSEKSLQCGNLWFLQYGKSMFF